MLLSSNNKKTFFPFLPDNKISKSMLKTVFQAKDITTLRSLDMKKKVSKAQPVVVLIA